MEEDGGERERERERERQTDRQTDQTDRQTDRQMETETERWGREREMEKRSEGDKFINVTTFPLNHS